jgi:cation:H+ antiporter
LPWFGVWLQFLLCAGVIGVSGTLLCRYGDVLGEKTGMGRTWIGLTVVAVITSLPETSTGVSAVLWVKAPDITVGDLLGSCVFNLMILAVVELLHSPGPVLTMADRGHLLAASFGVVMLGVAAMGVMTRSPTAPLTMVHVGLSSPVLVCCYLVAMRALFRYQRRERVAYLADHEEELLYGHIGMKEAALKFVGNALVVAAAGIWMPRVADHLAQLMGWKQSLVGSVFVAAATSLPELVVTLGALQLGAVDLAVGNLFGSNLINLALIGLMDVLYYQAPILQVCAPEHVGTALMAILMTGIAMAEMMYRPQKKALRWMSLGAFLLALLFGAHIFLQMVAKG